jgi:hypothetical protein
VPTKKQRRRRAKEHRHEYEYVLVDEEGRETELDPAELRAKREERAKGREKPAAQKKDARGRPLRPVKPPSWQRSAKRAGIFVAVLFVFLAVVPAKKKSPIYVSGALALLYGAAAVPFFYWMDRMAYRRFQRASGADGESARRR